MIVILDNAFGNNKDKTSPDNRLKGYLYTRKLVRAISDELSKKNIKTYILVPEDYDVSMTERVRRVNTLYEKDKGSFLISCCLNTASILGEWKSARGWSVFVANNPIDNSKRLANNLYNEAVNYSLNCRKPSVDQNYWKQNIYICKNTKCPAVVTQNLFLDNKEDVAFLLSERGFKSIVELHVNAILEYISGK